MTYKLRSVEYPEWEVSIESGPFYIGRGAENDLVPRSQSVSRKHALIEVQNGVPVVTDLNSGTGTFVNGQRIQRTFLKTGDQIGFGDTQWFLEESLTPIPGAEAGMQPPPYGIQQPTLQTGTEPSKRGRRRLPAWVLWGGGVALVILAAIIIIGGLLLSKNKGLKSTEATAQAQAASSTAAGSITATVQARATEAVQVFSTNMAEAEATATAAAASTLAAESIITSTAQVEQAAFTATAQAISTATAQAYLTQTIPLPTVIVQTGQWPVILSDSFEDNHNNWRVSKEETEWATTSQVIENGVYHWEMKAKRAMDIWSTINVASDEVFSLSVRTKVDPNMIYGSYGLVFHYQDKDNFYIFKLDGEGRYIVQVQVNGKWKDILAWRQASAIKTDGENTLTVVAQGDQYAFYINEQFVGQAKDTAFTGGQTGLILYVNDSGEAVSVDFDDFVMRVP